MSECTNNLRQADMVIAKIFFYNLCIYNFENNGKNGKFNLILSSVDDLKLKISSIKDKINSFDKRITKNENWLSKIEKMQQNLEKSMQNLQAEVQQIAKAQAKLQYDTQLDLLNKDL